MRMTWKQCLLICGLLLAADRMLYGAEMHKPATETRQVIGGRGYTPSEIKAMADRTERELANVRPPKQMKPVVKQLKLMSTSQRAVLMAKPDPHPESADWLTIATR